MSRKAPEDYDCFIYKRDLRRFFVDLRKQAHYIYALLEGAPKSVFWIVLENEDSDADEQTFTVKEFYANVAKFHHRKDTFRLYFEAYFFRDEWDECVDGWRFMDNPFNGKIKYEISDPGELSVDVFEKEWPHLQESVRLPVPETDSCKCPFQVGARNDQALQIFIRGREAAAGTRCPD